MVEMLRLLSGFLDRVTDGSHDELVPWSKHELSTYSVPGSAANWVAVPPSVCY